jgi:hypothetical protein
MSDIGPFSYRNGSSLEREEGVVKLHPVMWLLEIGEIAAGGLQAGFVRENGQLELATFCGATCPATFTNTSPLELTVISVTSAAIVIPGRTR